MPNHPASFVFDGMTGAEWGHVQNLIYGTNFKNRRNFKGKKYRRYSSRNW